MRGQEKSRPRHIAIRALGLLAVLGIGWVIGRAGSTTAPAGPVGSTSPAGPPASGKTRAGIPVDFPDTAKGAASAVAAYQRAFASPSILKASVLRERIKAVATPDYAPQMLEANSPGREMIEAGPIGIGVAAGLQTIYSAVPIGYEIEAFSPTRARILTWGFTLLGNSSAVEPAAYFGLTHTELLWVGGSWRIAATRAGFGPTPKLATEPGPLGTYDVIGVASRLTTYEPAA